MFKILEKKMEKIFSNSIIVIDKKAGLTSHDEVFNLRRILKTKKIGHSGTLDPKVTGLLAMGVGKGLKILEYMLLSEKVYEAEFIFHKEIEREKFEETRKKFLGKISQLPPVKSAVKREIRVREIYDLKILDFDKKKRWVKLRTAVERGTYIRKLAHDMGEEIGVIISMGDLRRIKVGPFSEKNSNFISSDLLKEKVQKFYKTKCFGKKLFYYFDLKKYFYSLEEFFEREKKFQKIFIKKEAEKYILAGNPIR
jgi:H/ACA ribonucleoprotein complex subunit 4